MKHPILFAILFFFTARFTLAQENFVPGFILTLAEDTLQGEIDYREWKNNPNEIKFRDSRGRSTAFTASDIKGFGLIGGSKDLYISDSLLVDITPVGDKAISIKEGPKFEKRSVFLRVLLAGQINLYELQESPKVHFFVQKGTGEVLELIYRIFLVPKGIDQSALSNSIVEDFSFRNQLLDITGDCSTLSKKAFKDLNYSAKSLGKILSKYNSCFGQNESDYIKKENQVSRGIFGIVGVSSSRVGFNLQNYFEDRSILPRYLPEYADMNYEFGPGFMAGVGINLQGKRNLGKDHTQFELLLHQVSHKGEGGDNTPFDFQLMTIQANIWYRRKLSHSHIAPYVGIGFSVSTSIAEEYNSRSRVGNSLFSISDEKLDVFPRVKIGLDVREKLLLDLIYGFQLKSMFDDGYFYSNLGVGINYRIVSLNPIDP
ncbi:MAG: hypothetical protein AAF694_26805 [Bacteroidota bacterium]